MEEGDNMEHITKIMPVLWSFIEKHRKCSVGIATIGSQITITLMWGRLRFKRFASHDAEILGRQVMDYIRAA